MLPVDGPQRARLARLLEAAGVGVLPCVTPELDVAVVDLSAPSAAAARRALAEGAPRCAVLGVGPVSLEVEPGVLELVSPAVVEIELVPRLARLRSRLATLAEAQQRERDSQVLLELTARYAEAKDLEQLLHEVTRRLAEEIQIDRVALVSLDSERQEGVIMAASDDAGLRDRRLDLARYPEVREVLRTGGPVIVEDAPSDPLLEDVKDSVAARGIRSLAALPLVVRGRVEGVLLLRRSTGGPFSPRELALLTTAANATAVAFRNLIQLERVEGQRDTEKSARIAAETRAADLKRYAEYFQHLSDGVAILNVEARVLSLNPAGHSLLDVAPGQAEGRHINSLAHLRDEHVLLRALAAVARGEVQTDLDVAARTSSGRQLTLAVSAAPLTGDAGDGVAIVTLRDVTRQRLMADELRQTKEFLERLIDSSIDAIVAADMRGNIILFNQAAEAACGWTSEEVVGKLNVTRLYPEGVAREIMRKLRSHEYGGKGRLTSTRVDVVSHSGELIPVNLSATILYEGMRETATVGLFTDLRDRLNLERRLTDAEARLLESEKTALIGALAGTIAHELNQPLTSVMGYTELLKRRLKEGDPVRWVEIIHKEAERMAEIVRRIGKVTRYETRPYVQDVTILDLDKAASHDE